MRELSYRNIKPSMQPLVRSAITEAFERAKVNPEGLARKIDDMVGTLDSHEDGEGNIVEFVRFTIEHCDRFYVELVLIENFTNGDQSAKAEGGKE